MLIKHARPTNLGHTLVSGGPGGAVEHETFACGHCQKVTVVPHRADPATVGGFCRQCMKLTCVDCARQGTCTPFQARLEMSFRRSQFLKQVR